MKKLNSENFAPLVGDWFKYLSPIIEGEQMYELYKFLKSQGKLVTPKSVDVWNCFKYTSPKALNVIVLAMEPYCGTYNDGSLQADGLALSCSKGEHPQPSLVKFVEGIYNEYEEEYEDVLDLKYLAEQGVMLANKSLTSVISEIGAHENKWDFFWEFFFKEVMQFFPGTPIVLLGKQAHGAEQWINKRKHPIFKLTHPSFAARQKKPWETKGTFKEISKLVYESHKESIIWNPKAYEISKALPF